MYSAHSWSPASCIRLYYKLAQLAAERSNAGVPQSAMLEAHTDSQTVNYTISCIRVVIFTSSVLASPLVLRPKHFYNIPEMSDLEFWDFSRWFGEMRLECSARIFMAHCGVVQDMKHCLSMVLGLSSTNKPNRIDLHAHLGTR